MLRSAEQGFLRLAFEALLIAVLLGTFARTWVLQGLQIPSGSMLPNLLVGDHVLVNKLVFSGSPGIGPLSKLFPIRSVRRGDILVFRQPGSSGTLLVKRCLGLPGERIEVVGRSVRIDGHPLDEKAYLGSIEAADDRAAIRSTPVLVPEDHCFVLGDSRDRSFDSRQLGPVASSAVLGRAFVIYWSFGGGRSEMGGGQSGASFARRPAGVRWRRMFHVVR